MLTNEELEETRKILRDQMSLIAESSKSMSIPESLCALSHALVETADCLKKIDSSPY